MALMWTKKINNTVQRYHPHPKDMTAQINSLKDRGFIIRIKKDKQDHLQLLLITTPDCVALTKRYGEVLVVDSTYKTNEKLLPLFNIASFTNIGKTKLSTFIAASVLMISEVKDNYVWALEQFKDVVWNESEAPNTKVNMNANFD
jgi:hypothetical protein